MIGISLSEILSGVGVKKPRGVQTYHKSFKDWQLGEAASVAGS